MSCMIADSKVVSVIADYLAHYLDREHGGKERVGADEYLPSLDGTTASIRAAFPGDCFTAYGDPVASSIHLHLYALNYAAYCGRYKEEMPDDVPPYSPSGVKMFHESREDWAERLYWALSFFLYQCGEDANESDPLYLALRRFEDGLARHIAHRAAKKLGIGWGDFK